MSEDLSARQQQVLDVIVAWADQHGVTPSYREIGRQLGIKSTNGVSDHVGALMRKGYLERVGGAGAARSLRLTGRARTHLEEDRAVGVPLLGRIAAGVPITAQEDHSRTLFVDRTMLPGGEAVFALEVNGESMIEDGILDGDVVFIQRRGSVRNGDMAAVLVDGEATVKRVYREQGGLRLQPSNSGMHPIWVEPDASEVEVLGHVVGVYRHL